MTVSADVAVTCLRCGYDLRTTDGGGVCPECGLAVSASTGPRERLRDCPPGWVRRVAIGAGVLAVAAVLYFPAAARLWSEALPILRIFSVNEDVFRAPAGVLPWW